MSAGTTATRSWASSSRVLLRTSLLRNGLRTACAARRRRTSSRLRKVFQVRAYQRMQQQVGTLGPNCPRSPTGRRCFPSPSTTSPDSKFGSLDRDSGRQAKKYYIFLVIRRNKSPKNADLSNRNCLSGRPLHLVSELDRIRGMGK